MQSRRVSTHRHLSKNLMSDALMPEDGSVTLEFSLVYGMLLGLIMTIVHFGLLFHVSLTASDAADVGLESLQSAATESSVADIVDDLVGDASLVRDLETSVEIVGNNARVSVSASSPQIIFGLPNHVERQAVGPLERFLTEDERRAE